MLCMCVTSVFMLSVYMHYCDLLLTQCVVYRQKSFLLDTFLFSVPLVAVGVKGCRTARDYKSCQQL